MNDFWKNKIRAFLHDPPDKIVILSDPMSVVEFRDHRKRRNEILGELKFREDRGVGKQIRYADETASSLQRIDLEEIDGKNLSSTFYKIHGNDYIFVGEPVLRHPITGKTKEYEYLKAILPKDEKSPEYPIEFDRIVKIILEAEKEAFSELISIADKIGDDKDKIRYFVIWRFYPKLLKIKLVERLKELCEFEEICERIAEDLINLTAYSLSPDHTLFDHADATSVIFGAMEKGTPALLMFKLTPVQDFIKNARKERDLWAGSHLLSYLTFKAIKVVVDKYGPDAVIFPHLRGQPFFDKEFEEKFKEVSDAVKDFNLNEKLRIANIPNKFLAIVGTDGNKSLTNLKNEIKDAVVDELCKIFDFAWNRIISDDLIKKVEFKLIELKSKKKEEEEKYEKALEELKKIIARKDFYGNLVKNYFKVTVETFEVPFKKDELNANGKQENRIRKSYEKLENYVKNLKLPENVESKYLDWLNLLKSFGAYPARIFDLYSLMFELLEEIAAIESRRFEKLKGSDAYKCSLCGGLEAIGGENYILMKALWDEISRNNPFIFKRNEHLCPICLVKRFYHEWLTKEKSWDVEAGFESVSEVALRKCYKSLEDGVVTQLDILMYKNVDKLDDEKDKEVKKLSEKLKKKYDLLNNSFMKLLSKIISEVYKERVTTFRTISENVEFFYKEKLNLDELLNEYGLPKFDEIRKNVKDPKVLKELDSLKDKIESIISEIVTLLDKLPFEPEKYYAILMMDGDNMGRMLVGDDMKTVDNYLHLKVVAQLPDELRDKIKDVKRLITPATHSAISRALAHFSINVVPSIVEKYRGELIYAGGDDVLALLPIDSALACAYKIWREFGKDWDGWNLLPAKKMSAGLLIAHYKHPLYDALDKVRSLEKKAKGMGRNAVAVGYLTRGGSYYEAVFNWNLIEGVRKIVDLMLKEEKPRISRRIIYNVIENIESLPNDEKAIEAYLKFELLRHYEGEDKKEKANKYAEKVLELFKGVRISLSSNDLKELEVDLSRVKLNRLKEKLNERISSNGSSIDVIKNVLSELSIECDDEELYGSILKKQVKGLFVLLKILRDCEFAGDVHEDSA